MTPKLCRWHGALDYRDSRDPTRSLSGDGGCGRPGTNCYRLGGSACTALHCSDCTGSEDSAALLCHSAIPGPCLSWQPASWARATGPGIMMRLLGFLMIILLTYPTLYKTLYYYPILYYIAAGAWTRQWAATGPRPPGTAAPARVAGCRPTGVRATVALHAARSQ